MAVYAAIGKEVLLTSLILSDFHGNEACFRRVLALQKHLDYIFFLGDGYVPFWIRALNLKGYTVPEDISIIGFDNSRETVLETGLTSLDFSLKKSGMQAFQLLYNEICSGIQNNIRINIKPKLIIRNTVSRRKS